MAALPSGVARAAPAASPLRGAHGASSVASRGACLAVSLSCAAAGLTIAGAYPIAPFVAMAAFIGWIAFAFARIPVALPALCALVPAAGFTAWTGRFTFEEVDLLVLASAAGGYAAWAILGAGPAPARRSGLPTLTPLSWALVALFLASLVVSLVRGIDAAGGLHFDPFDWSAGYESAQNSVRVFKPFVFAALLAPLLQRNLREPGGFDRLCAGMTASLGIGALLVLQERLTFTGLLDFSDDYRVTGSFWEMHVGGAALDGFLALTIPFALRDAVRHENRVRTAASMIVLALAAYASLVTFSRGVYGAVPASLITLFVLTTRQRVRVARGTAWTLFAKACVYAVVVAACGFLVFRFGGYRAVLATFGVIATAMPADRALRRLRPSDWIVALVAATVLAVFGWAAATILPKGTYVVYAAAFCATLAAVVHAERSADPRGAPYVVASWLWLSFCAVTVARYWGGPRAFADSTPVLAAFVVLVVAASRLPRSIWPVAYREQLVTAGIAAGVLGVVAVFSGGAYMGDRWSATSGDLESRLGHWKNGIGRLHDSASWALGNGLGRFPATSRFEPPESGGQGTYALMRSDGESFARLTAPHIQLGFGQVFRMMQRVPVRPHTHYVLTVVGRSLDEQPAHLEICKRHLLYVSECQISEPVAKPLPNSHAWSAYTFAFDSGTMGQAHWWEDSPVFLALATYRQLDVRSVRLEGPDGIDLVANGRFRDQLDRWFSSSDRYHLPWHTKNMELAVLVDQGLVGLALFALLVGGALLRTTFGRAFRHPDAPFVAAALVGYGVVGVTDSLLDVPRVALLFYLVVLTGLMLRNPQLAPDVRSSSPPTPPPPRAPVLDEAGERARRRQQAFGTRKRADA